MNRYLEKIAKEYYQETRVEDPSVGNKLGLGAAVATTVGIVNKKIGQTLQNKIGLSLLNAEPTIPSDVLKKIEKEVLPATNSTMNLGEVGGTKEYAKFHDRVGSMGGPHYAAAENMTANAKRLERIRKLTTPITDLANRHLGTDFGFGKEPFFDKAKPYTKNYVYAGLQKNTDALAHELGHAVDLNGKFKGLKLRADRFSRGMTGVKGALIGGAMLGSEKTKDYAWLAPLVGAAPMLRSEAAANMNMLKLVAKHGGNAKGLKGLIAKNTASYLLAPLITSGTIAGINHLRTKGEEINPDEWLANRD